MNIKVLLHIGAPYIYIYIYVCIWKPVHIELLVDLDDLIVAINVELLICCIQRFETEMGVLGGHFELVDLGLGILQECKDVVVGVLAYCCCLFHKLLLLAFAKVCS